MENLFAEKGEKPFDDSFLDEVVDPAHQDGADLPESSEPGDEFKSKELGFEQESDESFDSISEADEPISTDREEFTDPRAQLYGSVDELEQNIREVKLRSFSFSYNGSSKFGVVSEAVTFNAASTASGGGWKLVVNLPNSVDPKAIADVREGVLRLILVPEDLQSTLIDDAVNTLIGAIRAHQLTS